MTSKEIREKIDELLVERIEIQTKINKLASKLTSATTEEMQREGIHQKTTQRVDAK